MSQQEDLEKTRVYVIEVQSGLTEPIYTEPRYRPSWMSDDQWRQAVGYLTCQYVPDDPEIVAGLRGDSVPDRAHRWAWSRVPALLVGHEEFELACSLMRSRDTFVDEGL